MKKNKIIVLEGTDGSGKSTQIELLASRLKKNKILSSDGCSSFPNYPSDSSYFVREYLKGAYGDVTGRLASNFFLMDQFDTMKKRPSGNLLLGQDRIIAIFKFR